MAGIQSNSFFRNPWFIWGLATITVLFQFLLQTSVSVMIANLRDAFNINVLGVSLISASFFYTYIFLQMPAGLLFDKFPARNILTIGIICVGFGCLLFAMAHSLSVAVVSRLIMGVFCAVAFPGVLYLAANLFPPQRFAFIVGVTEMFGMSGAALGEQFLAVCVEHHGWRQSMLYCSATAFLLAILLYWVLDKQLAKPVLERFPTRKKSSVLSKLLLVIKMPQAWLCGIYSGLMFTIISTFASLWCITYIVKLYNISLTQAATASALIFFGAAMGNPLFGWISDHTKRRKPILLISAGLTLLLLTIIFYTPHISLLTLNFLLFGLGFVCCGYALPFAIAREITPFQCQGAMMGFINMLGISVGAPILQPIIGWLLNEHYGMMSDNRSVALNPDIYRHVIGNSLIACALLAFALGFIIKETYCRDTSLSQQ
ncbi:MAG: Transporter, superfamily [Gammaproteobacteria bacterium]|jgi:MFS family permease|nr:Transporter, superfamily [Gammaproteobacteria bacterium]